MRLLIIIGLIYLAYRLLKAKMSRILDSAASGGQIDEVMVKDPVCGTHFLKRDGVHLQWQGEEIHFCSEACRDRFRSEQEGMQRQ